MSKKKTPYIQFSKRLTFSIVVFWFIARAFSLVAIFLNPSCGSNLSLLVKGIDDIVAVCVIAYTTNSVGEKGLNTFFGYKKYVEKNNKNSEEECEDEKG